MRHRARAFLVAWAALLLAPAARTAGQEEFPAQVMPALRAAQARLVTSFRQLVETNQLRFAVASGRVTLGHVRVANFSNSMDRGDRREDFSIRMQPEGLHFDYEFASGGELLAISIRAGRSVDLQYHPAEGTQGRPVVFAQAAGEPTVLSIGSGSHQERYQAPSLWHLLIAHPEPCREHLLPHLEVLRPDWQLDESARAVERELLRMAGATGLPDRERWAELVVRLGDERYAVREAADRELRSSGRQVVTFLEGLEPAQLDAEQHFRIQRMLRAFTEDEVEDVPTEVASAMLGDAAIWLALLDREEAATRRVATDLLTALTGRVIEFDPDADPATRDAQAARLRARLGQP